MLPGDATTAPRPESSPAPETRGGSTPEAAPQTPTAPDAGAVRRLRETIHAEATGYDNPVSAKELSAVKTRPGRYRTVGTIAIPRIGLDVSYGEGVFAKTLDRGPGHWPGTPSAGSRGNAVLSGHRNTHTQPFKELDELSPGDKIITTVGDGDPVTFEVVKTTIVPQARYKDFVLRPPADPDTRQLTLFACHPEGNPVFRIVVTARAQR